MDVDGDSYATSPATVMRTCAHHRQILQPWPRLILSLRVSNQAHLRANIGAKLVCKSIEIT